MSLFNGDLISNPDTIYLHHRNCESKEDIRNLLNGIYTDLNPYLGDEDIPIRFQQDFHAFTWQVYLGHNLKMAGINLLKASEHGPDFLLNNGTIVEAVISTRGEGANRTFASTDMTPKEIAPGIKMYPAVSKEFPDPKTILRISSSIKDKLTQYRAWRLAGVVEESQPYVIGINSMLLEDAAYCPDYSYGARVCFGLGPTQISIPIRSNSHDKLDQSKIKTSIRFDSHIKKHNGQSILSSIFFDDEYKDVSALAYSPHYIGNVIQDLGKDIEIIFNPNANNPIDMNDYINFKRTYVEFDETRSSFIVKQLDRGERV